jgi:hypothetical protein
MATEKQRAANRQNAQKSTGPKTDEGKAVAKLNAAKHGILSEAVVILKGDGQERKDAYLALHHGLREYFQPQGTMEDTLVEQIVVTLWRKRRVLRYELGCLRQQLDGYSDAAEGADEQRPTQGRPNSTHQRLAAVKTRLAHHQQERRYLQEGYDILSDDEVGNWEESYAEVAERKGIEAEEPADIRDQLKKQGLSEAQIRHELLAVEEAAIQAAQAEIKALEFQVALEREREVLLASIPAQPWQVDRIIRYEASLDRQLYKAINQLERLQRRRKGEDVPAPVVLDET